ncbi:hypothetical protein LTR95_005478 [Oleoguttula sp. CCFEE 5521]
MDTREPVEPEPMVSPCTALLDRRLQARISEHEDAMNSAWLAITTESVGQRITDPAIDGPQEVLPDSILHGTTEQAESDVNERSPLLRKQSSPSQSGISLLVSGSLHDLPSVREDGVECVERGPHTVLAASNEAPYGDEASSEIAEVPFQSSEANVEKTVATSTEHPQTSSSDQQGTGGGMDGTCRASDESRPGGSVEDVDHVEANANRAGEAEENVQSVDEIEEDDRAERNEQAKQPDYMHHAAAGREEHSRNNIEAGEETKSNAEADGDALPGAAAKEGCRATTEKDRTSQTAAPERHRTSSGTIRVSDRVMIPSQSRAALTDETPSPQKATGVARSTQQSPEAAPNPRRRRKRAGSLNNTQKLSGRTSTAEECEEGSSLSSSENGVVQDPLTTRMQLTRESYRKFGFDFDLVFRHGFPDFEPCGISLAKSAKLITVSEVMVSKLEFRADAMKDHLRRFTQEDRMDEEVNLYEALKQKIAEEKEITYLDELRDVYHCVHCILDRLDLAWYGLHLLLALFLRASIPQSLSVLCPADSQTNHSVTVRIPMKKLIPDFAVATRPAGIELLSRELNEPDFSGPCLRFLRSILAHAKLSNEPGLRFSSPLERLEEWYGSEVP